MKILLTVVLFAAACALLGLTVIATQSPPKITRPVMFDTPEADRILAALQVFPPDNPWNQDISKAPVHANSAAIIASIGKDKHIDFNLDMNYIIVPPNQPRVPVKIKDYPNESDPGPYPVPDNMPIENWPMQRNEDAGALLQAKGKTDENLPRMGERLRLRRDFDIKGFPPHAQAILKGLKKHGMFVADNGGDWRLSIAPDRRLKGLESLTRLKGSDFEVVDTEKAR